jgi:hypothetical protein
LGAADPRQRSGQMTRPAKTIINLMVRAPCMYSHEKTASPIRFMGFLSF